MKAKYTKKITMRSVGLSPDDLQAIALERKTETPVVRIVGRITSTASGVTQIGPYVRFNGEFMAVNLVTNEEYRGMNLIVPGPAQMLLEKLTEAAKKTDKDAVAQFGCDITVREHKSTYESGYKFTYGVASLVDSPKEDALSLLAAQFGALPLLTDQTEKKKAKK